MTLCPICGNDMRFVKAAKHFPDPGTSRRKDICIALGVPQGTFDHIETRRRMCLSHFDDEDFLMHRKGRIIKPDALPRELTKEEKDHLLKSHFNIRRYVRPKDEVIALYGESSGVSSLVKKKLPSTSTPSSKPKVIQIDGIFKIVNGNNQQILFSSSSAAVKDGHRKRKLPPTPKPGIKILLPAVSSLPSTSQANTSSDDAQETTTKPSMPSPGHCKKPRINYVQPYSSIIQGPITRSRASKRQQFKEPPAFKVMPTGSNIKVISFRQGNPPPPSTSATTANNDSKIIQVSNAIHGTERSLDVLNMPTATAVIKPSSRIKLLYNQSHSNSQSTKNAATLNNSQEMDTSSITNLLLARCSQLLPNDSDQCDNDDGPSNSTVNIETETITISDD